RLLSTAGRARRIWAAITVVFVAGDLWLAYGRIHAMGYGPKPEPTRDREVLALDGIVDGRFRIYDRGLAKFRPGVRLRIRDFGGYEDDPLGLARYRDFKNAAVRSPRLLGHANVRYVLDGRKPKLALRAPWSKPLGGGFYRLESVAARVLYLPNARQVNDVGEAMRMLRTIEPGKGGVIAGIAPPTDVDAKPVAGQVTSFGPNHLRAEIEVPGPGVVILAEAYYPAWQATLNGKPTELYPGNGMFTAVVVPEAGRASIEMRLSPPRFYWTLPLPLLALVALGWALWGLRRQRSRG
ncbi:MAG: YfhO family protein, partial [Deltaproteobacteria bacterium]|nr:YfhO family protein [Deltaproteobacteria bacterium]